MRLRVVMPVVLIGMSSLAIVGCASGDTGSPRSATATSKGTVAASGSRENCELKNPTGTGPCEDGRGTQSESASAERPFKPSDCTTFGPGGYVLLAELGHRMTEWKAYCRQQETANSDAAFSPRQDAANQDGANDDATDTSGTWYCDTVDGSGVYGRYGMRYNSNIDASSCKRVSD